MTTINNRKVTFKTKKNKKAIEYNRLEPSNDYMKYYRVVKYWAMKRYDLTGQELDILFFLYSERLFNYYKFVEYCNIMSWDRQRFKTMNEKGLIHVWRKPAWKEIRLYELTYKARRIVNDIYKRLNGQESIPVTPRRNPVMRKDGSFTDKVMAKAILKFNSELKAQQQRLVLESHDK